jgi:hypothetical protein
LNRIVFLFQGSRYSNTKTSDKWLALFNPLLLEEDGKKYGIKGEEEE